jgi:phosphatidylserine/phosphatidylglycerophosphate/cardiolipin synthase-like enzyme
MIETIIGKQFPEKVIPLLNNAKNSVDIIIFDWRWYPQDPGSSAQLFSQSVIRAARRGVKVRVIANNQSIANILNQNGCFAKKLLNQKLVHVKLMIIDDEIVVTGSHNYTQSAFQVNLELSVILTQPECMADFKSFFNNLYG